ncbi:MAG: S8 family serine peptidase [Pseudomonadota bacterium]|nr:S8 family serine peptidase [Pseudomonadota bacterium]
MTVTLRLPRLAALRCALALSSVLLIPSQTSGADGSDGGASIGAASTDYTVPVTTPTSGRVRVVGKDVRRILGKGRVLVIVSLKRPARLRHATTDVDVLRREVAQIQRRVLSSLKPSDLEMIHRYEFVAGFSGWLTRPGLRKLRRNPDVVAIQLDRRGGSTTAESVPLIRANEWAQVGISGDGVAVAVLDSGVVDHPDLADDLLLESCILKANLEAGGTSCPDGSGEQLSESGAALDSDGHGTHVTGIITSNGVIAPPGVAPGAEFLAIKVMDNEGYGRISDTIAGLDHVITLLSDFDIRVVNMSTGWEVPVGECNQGYGEQTRDLVSMLEQQGVLVVAASGNDSNRQQITYPACVDGVFSVGATDDDDNVMWFTNSSPELDVMAPGDNILSTGITATGILTLTGTSQAAPHVSACAALRLEDDPTLTPDKLKQILKVTNVFVTDENNGLSFPRLRCGRPVLM